MLDELQDQAVKLMEADAFYQRVTPLRFDEGQIAQKIQTEIAKLGICAVVHITECRAQGSEAPGPLFNPLRLAVDIFELVVANRGPSGSGIPASRAAERTAQLLHAANHPARADAYRLACESIGQLPDKTFLVYRVLFRTSGLLETTVNITPTE